MSSSAASALPRNPSWIVSAWWDLSYIVITPLLIVPVVLILAQNWLTPEQVSLGVIAFASLGHHLPGFMRAYGDRELFARYRLRFLFVPVMVLAIALLFSPPSGLARAFGLPWTHLHGLELVLLIWGTWHGLMQTYGFMRIYDIRQGVNDRWTARLDHWLCLSVFAAGVAFSDARVFGIANAMWQCGLPTFGPQWLEWLRLGVGGAAVATLAAYVVNQVRLRRQGIQQSWVKLLLIATTGWFYWYTGRLSTNVLIGIAMFEIYHAVQYYAIVWIYNRRLFQRAGERFGPLGFLFRDRWTMLGIYLAAIAAYSSIRLFAVDANGYVFVGGNQDAHQWLIALFVTSSFLHFYFDGFIWKVSEKKTQQNLVDEITHSSIGERYVPALLHASKWGILLAVIAGLLYTERFQSREYGEREVQRRLALMRLTPELPECQTMLCEAALERGDTVAALAHAEKAVLSRPRSHVAQADLSLALFQSGKFDEARGAIERAIEIAPNRWQHHADLGIIYAAQNRDESAEQALLRAVQLAPELRQPREQLAEFYLRTNRDAEATEAFEEIAKRFPKSLTGELGKVLLLSQEGKHQDAVELASFLAIDNPNNWRVQQVLGSAYNDSGEPELALRTLRVAKRLRPQSAEIHYQIGLAEAKLGEPSKAVTPLIRAIRLDPSHFRANFQLANVYYLLSRYELALEAFARCQELDPQHPELCANLGGLLARLGRFETAEQVYRAGLARHPESGQLNYNLGILLWQRGNTVEARRRILAAEQTGTDVSPEVRSAILAE
ncbi:MAG: tetratricopeptide repeat protein [Planctomycetota bacterium]